MGIPKTVLSTRMTGSARETEGRIRALYQHHRRPAIALVVLAALAAALCGALVSCQTPPDSPFAFRVGAGGMSWAPRLTGCWAERRR